MCEGNLVSYWSMYPPKILTVIIGTLVLTEKRALQGSPSSTRRKGSSALDRHEGSLELNVCHVIQGRVSYEGRFPYYLAKRATDISFFQAINQFVYELGLREKNLEKRRKLDHLVLTDEEWTRVGLFCNLLGVSKLFICRGCFIYYLFSFSMPMKRSRLFQLIRHRPSITPFLRLNPCTLRGRRPQINPSMQPLCQHCNRVWRNLTTIIRSQPPRMPTLWLWVS